MGVVAMPQQRVRINRRRVGHRNAAQTVPGRPHQPGLRADESGQRWRVGDGVEQRVGAQVGPGRLDGEAELGRQLVVVGGPFGAGGEATTWTATVLGPPLGNAALGLLGPVTTVVIDAFSYLLSALGLRAIGGPEPRPARADAPRLRARDLLGGWRHILNHPALRLLFFNTVLVNGLILATAPLLAVLMLNQLGFASWQYGLAFGIPCLGGLLGSRLARPLVASFGQHRVLRTAGALRACWPIGLAFMGPGTPGLILVLVVQFALVTCVGVFNPVFATYRLDQTAPDRVVRTLSAWSVTSNATVAALTALWGLLATATSPRVAIATAGLLLLTTPLLLPRHTQEDPVMTGTHLPPPQPRTPGPT
ncbi:MFS transporter [Paractinoplanes lichenicola]|uniref:MFS transporter n=1 Tax=Paractinoplanes lichenicola TaxID=2802976 RepID=A0ABS1VE42_9ACTN|nr:MFS transporter [Actinoplanes lichenicola]MBL7252955.1 MFS transporter [Actinoplanes lichenicola]